MAHSAPRLEDTKTTLDGLGPRVFAVSGVVGLVGLAATVAYLSVFAPEPYQPPPVPFRGYDRRPFMEAIAPEAVRATCAISLEGAHATVE